ncbi:transposase [Haloechinothrix alba]|uniref:transposase n=1 Tax=Haloechinothrix alba TaxID=664784 RepID=UPI003CCB87B6
MSRAAQGAGSNYTQPTIEPRDHALGRSRGGLSTKIHQLVGGGGLPLVTLLTAGQAGDSPMLLPLLRQLRVDRRMGRPRTRTDAVRADKAYSSRAIRAHLRSRGITAVFPNPTIRNSTARTAVHAAAGLSGSTPPNTGTAT